MFPVLSLSTIDSIRSTKIAAFIQLHKKISRFGRYSRSLFLLTFLYMYKRLTCTYNFVCEVWKLDRVDFYTNDLKVCLRIFVVFEGQNSPSQLFECEEEHSDTCSRGNVSWFNISSCYAKQFTTNSQHIYSLSKLSWTDTGISWWEVWVWAVTNWFIFFILVFICHPKLVHPVSK